MKNKNFKFAFWFLTVSLGLVLAACGDGEDGERPREFSISPTGGSAEIEGVARIEFPEGAFASEVNLSIQEESEKAVLDNYSESAVMFDAGGSMGHYLKIISSSAPQKDAIIHYTVSQEFISSLGEEFRPRLFARIYQLGSDNENLDYFEPLDFNLEGNLLTTTLPPWVFTELRSENKNEFEAIILVGSSPVSRVQPASLLQLKTATISKTTSNGSCNGASIGSPLEGELEVTSDFGIRTDRMTGTQRFHFGTDFRAMTEDNVLAVADGTIDQINYNQRGWGRYVVLKHTDGSKTLYAHLLEGSTDHVKVGDTVIKGLPIGRANSSGRVDGPHLHFEYAPNGMIYNDDSKIDPVSCMDSNLTGQITVSDNGHWADDSFSLTLDGILIGTTDIGRSNTFAINNLREGDHTIVIKAVIAPDNEGTMYVKLDDGVTFMDDSKSKSEILTEGGSVSYVIHVVNSS